MSEQYIKLKSLLLQEEMDKIQTLTQDIKALEQIQEKDILVERLSHIITDILAKSLQNNQQQLYATLQPLLSKSVTDELYRSKDLQKILFPIITSAIHEQVHQQKESIVDALYPIMGNMISKYVSSAFTDMMHEINNRLQSSLSFSRVKRKIKSKIYGVSEAQLLLQETDFVEIETVFLIHKESGLLIVDLHKEENQKIEEVEMVASMLSAIRSFVNDWISNDKEMNEIREIEYSNSSISIESAGSCYLAVVTSNHADMKDTLSKVLSRVVSKHSQELSEYDGDTSKIDINHIKAILSTLFDKEKDTTQDKFPILGALVLFGLLVLPLGWYGYNYYKEYIIEQNEMKIDSLLKENHIKVYDLDIQTTKEHNAILNGIVLYQEDQEKVDVVLRGYPHTNQINSIDSNFNKNHRVVLLDKLIHAINEKYHSNISYTRYYNKLRFTGLLVDEKNRENFITQVNIILDNEIPLFNIEVLSPSVKKIVNETNKKYRSNITYHQAFDKVRFSGIIIDKKAKDTFISKIQIEIEKSKIINEIKVLPTLKYKIYFDLGSSTIDSKYDKILDKLTSIINKYSHYYIKINGYTDDKGSSFINKKLSLNRANNIKQELINRGIKKNMLMIKAVAKPPIEIENIQDKDKESLSRCVMFNWEISSEK